MEQRLPYIGTRDGTHGQGRRTRRNWCAMSNAVVPSSTAFNSRGDPEPGVFADAALDALTVWRYTGTGELCQCGCHPRRPETDLHDYGFDCLCTRTPEERRRVWEQWRNNITAFWESPDGQQITAGEQTAEADLQAWLADQHDVVVGGHGTEKSTATASTSANATATGASNSTYAPPAASPKPS